MNLGGYRRCNLKFYIGHVPERKKPCLFVQKDNVAYMVGQFRSDEDANDFLRIITFIMLGNDEDKAYEVFEKYEKRLSET